MFIFFNLDSKAIKEKNYFFSTLYEDEAIRLCSLGYNFIKKVDNTKFQSYMVEATLLSEEEKLKWQRHYI